MRKPWEAEHRVDEARAKAFLRAERVELLGEGWDNVAYLADGFVFRFPRNALAAELLVSECAFMGRIAPHVPVHAPVPEIVGRPPDFPWPVARHAYVRGTTADRARLTDAQREALARPLGRFLRALHDLHVDGLPGDTIGRMDPGRRIRPARERLAALTAMGLIAAPDPWLPLLESLPLGPRPSCTLHGDVYCRQLVLDDSRALTGVIDWGDLHRGDPACDLMVAFAFVPRAPFEEAYGGIDDETARLARFRALSHSLGVTVYAHDIGDEDLLREGRRALALLAPG